MPIVVQSPLAAAANSAASFLQGQTEAGIRNRAAALAQQKQDSEDALQRAQAQMYLGHGYEFQAQGDQRTALTPSMAAKNIAGATMQDAHGNLFDAQGKFLTGPETNYEVAKTGLTTAQTGLTNANTGLTNAKTAVQLQGELPFLKAKTSYTASLPGYNAQRIMALNNATDQRAFSAAQATGARIQVAGLDNQGRIVLGSMVNDRIANGQSEADAMKGALDQYNEGLKAYASANAANNALLRAGQPSGPTPVAPTFKDPRVSQGGVTLNLSLPSQGIGQGPNGMPTYSAAPPRSINVQGEVSALKAALNSPQHDPNAVRQIFNSRTDLTPPQKANIWAAANTPTQQPPTSPGVFRVPLGGAPAVPPSVGGSMFNLPQAPFQIPGTGSGQ